MSLNDGMAVLGFLLLAGGLGFAIGPAWASAVAGALLLSIALFAVWRRTG